MTTGMAWCPVRNMMIIKNKVTNGMVWCPVSHGVSPKGVFDCLESAKIAGKFFLRGSKNSFLLSSNVNEAIRAILNFFIFFRKDFNTHKKYKMHISEQQKKGSIFMRLKYI